MNYLVENLDLLVVKLLSIASLPDHLLYLLQVFLGLLCLILSKFGLRHLVLDLAARPGFVVR